MICLKQIVMQAGLGIILINLALLPAVAGQGASLSLRQGLPGRRISGGTRSECMAGSASVVALSPETNLGETMSAGPSLYFIIPKLENAYPLEFSLRDSENNRVYEKSLNTREENGVVGIQLPPQSLAMNQDYRWYLSVVCDAQDPAQNDVLSGWVRQVEPDVETTNGLRVVAPYSIVDGLELVRRYQALGLWNDAISTVVSLREQYPTDGSVAHSWNQLLQTLKIEAAVNAQVATR